MMAKALAMAFLFLGCATYAQQPWSGLLDPSRALNWSIPGVEGGVPNYINVCSTINPASPADPTGVADSTAINNALSTCSTSASATSPQVVMLGQGVFYSNASIGPPMGSKYVVLRGQGPDKTTIRWVGTSPACGRSPGVDLCFNGYNGNQISGAVQWTGTQSVIGTYTQGSLTMDVASTTGILPGLILLVTQRDDAIGLCLQSGGTGNCSGITGLINSSGTVTAVTSIPWPEIVAGAKVYVGSRQYSLNGNCGGYQTAATAATVLTASTNATNTTFTYSTTNTLTSPVGDCQPIFAAVDNGGLFTCPVNGGCISSNSSAGISCPNSTMGSACQAGEQSRWSQTEMHVVKAVCTGPGAGSGTQVSECLAANELVLDTPVIAPNYRTARYPIAYWAVAYSATRYSDHVGAEAMTLDSTNDGNAFATVLFLNCSNFWLKNIRGLNTYADMVFTGNSVRGSILDSYFYGTQHTGPNSYGIDLGVNTSFVLIQNNILQHMVSALQIEQAYGNVRGYNYAFDANTVLANAMNTLTSSQHGYAGANLDEGNNTNQCAGGGIHGTSYGITYFRNRCRGQDTPQYAAASTLMSGVNQAFQRGWGWIGNVMGTVGYQQTYVQNGTIPPFPNEGTFWLNIGAYTENVTGGGQYPVGPDPLVTTSLIRWGNYDVATGATTNQPRWCATGSETGCSINSPSGPTSELAQAIPFLPVPAAPASHTLPPSFYLTAKPTWWSTAFGTPKWPAIGPDVSGGTAPDGTCNLAQAFPQPCSDGGSGMADSIPAQLVANNMQIDTAYQDANTVTGAVLTPGTTQWQNTATLSGTFTMGAMSVFRIAGMTPTGWNGTYQATYSNGPAPADYPAASATFVAGSLAGNTSYRVAYTRVNVNGETKPSISTTVTTASTCPSTGSCGIQVNAPCASSTSCYYAGYPAIATNPLAADRYNVYMALQQGSLCKQNTTPIVIPATFTIDGSTVPFIQPGSSCISPPTASTATGTSVTFSKFFDPGGAGTGGTITEPLIGVFNANNYYGVTTLVPTKFTGSGKITGQGKLSLSTVVVSTASPASPR